MSSRWMRILHLILSGMSPFAASLVVILYFAILHRLFIFSSFSFSMWMLVLLAPPVVFEVWFTRIYEVRRHGWSPVVYLGLAGRIFFIVCCYYACVWYTLLFNNTPDPFLSLFRKWPYVIHLTWTASPKLAVILGAVVVGAYLGITVRHRRFRLQTTVVIPVAATALLAYLLYLQPTSPLRLEGGQRPPWVQKVFPGDEFPGSTELFKTPMFAREVYVDPSDRLVVMTFGASYGGAINDQPNLVWLDLENRQFKFERMAQARNFFSECPGTVYVAPWHDRRFYSLDPQAGRLEEHLLPRRVGPFPIVEIAYIYHACDISTVYLANSRNPVLFAWDTRSQTLKGSLPLAVRGHLHFGDSLAGLARNQPRGKLYLVSVGKHELTEIDEDTLEPTRFIGLPHDPFDVRVSPDGNRVYVSSFLQDKIWQLDADSLELEAAFNAPAHPRRIGLSPDARLLFAAGYLSGEVAVLDALDGSRLLDFYVTPKLEGMFVTGRYLYLLGAEGMFRVSLEKLEDRIGR